MSQGGGRLHGPRAPRTPSICTGAAGGEPKASRGWELCKAPPKRSLDSPSLGPGAWSPTSPELSEIPIRMGKPLGWGCWPQETSPSGLVSGHGPICGAHEPGLALEPQLGPMHHTSAADGCGLTSTKHDAGPPHAAGTTEKRGITRRGRPATGGAAPMPNSLRIALRRGAAPWVVMASERHCPEGRGQLWGAMCLSLGNPGSYPSWLSAPQPIGRGGSHPLLVYKNHKSRTDMALSPPCVAHG